MPRLTLYTLIGSTKAVIKIFMYLGIPYHIMAVFRIMINCLHQQSQFINACCKSFQLILVENNNSQQKMLSGFGTTHDAYTTLFQPLLPGVNTKYLKNIFIVFLPLLFLTVTDSVFSPKCFHFVFVKSSQVNLMF